MVALHLLILFLNSSSLQRTQTFVKSRAMSPALSVRLLSQWDSVQVLGGDGTWPLVVQRDRMPPSTEQQAAAKARREQELAASAFQELDDNEDGV